MLYFPRWQSVTTSPAGSLPDTATNGSLDEGSRRLKIGSCQSEGKEITRFYPLLSYTYRPQGLSRTLFSERVSYDFAKDVCTVSLTIFVVMSAALIAGRGATFIRYVLTSYSSHDWNSADQSSFWPCVVIGSVVYANSINFNIVYPLMRLLAGGQLVFTRRRDKCDWRKVAPLRVGKDIRYRERPVELPITDPNIYDSGNIAWARSFSRPSNRTAKIC